MTNAQTEPRVEVTPAGGGGGALSQAGDHASEVAHHAGDELATVLDTTKDQARGLVDGVRARAGEEAGSATGRAAEALAGTARDLTDLASGEGSPDSPAAQFVRQAGERMDRAAEQLRDRGYQGVAEDVSRWARAHPGAFLAAAAGAGFVIGRVFRAADTKSVVDAAKGSSSGGDDTDATTPFDQGDPALVASARPSELIDGPPLGAPSTLGATVDLTDPPAGPIAGV
jgi:hypothetical protein